MTGWAHHTGTAVSLPRANIDTDQLIPARFMSVPRGEGYGSYLMHDLRRDDGGKLNEDFPLNQAQNASILIAGANFGSGSSREAAVYALVDAGFRVVIAPSFGDIFASNAVNNGLLPAQVSIGDAETLAYVLSRTSNAIEIDLHDMSITVDDYTYFFELPEAWRTKLINGWDDIDLTLQHTDDIRRFRDARQSTAPWAFPTVP